ncbi:hypothetical protein [Sphingomonas sp.]|uniref:hypothetical protein n=1 Tax=Sphingomonas sp. TaxID=28214 RepID=UPI002EDA5029
MLAPVAALLVVRPERLPVLRPWVLRVPVLVAVGRRVLTPDEAPVEPELPLAVDPFALRSGPPAAPVNAVDPVEPSVVAVDPPVVPPEPVLVPVDPLMVPVDPPVVLVGAFVLVDPVVAVEAVVAPVCPPAVPPVWATAPAAMPIDAAANVIAVQRILIPFQSERTAKTKDSLDRLPVRAVKSR